jgi:O-antigen/teichoic acid export membrane protein
MTLNRADVADNETSLRPESALASASPAALRARLLNGSGIMLLSSSVVGATNLFYNLILARSLGAVEFGHASVIYTSLMLTSAIMLAFQLVCSKLIARSSDHAEKVGIYQSLARRSWQMSLVIGGLIIAASPVITHYLNLPRQIYVVLLGIGATIYIPLGVRRGRMQGTYDFRGLALNSVLEVMTKLIGALLLLRSGLGVTGVITAVVASVALAYLVASPGGDFAAVAGKRLSISLHEGVQATVFFVGQAAINNLDIILVKHLFPAAIAGLYAAVALVGRAVYILCWSVVSGMFPVSAGSSHDPGRRTVLRTALLLVTVLGSLFTLAVWFTPEALWSRMLGAAFLAQFHVSFSSLLALYALLTSVYAIAVVLMTYEMSHRIANTGWLQLAFSCAIALGICLFHSTLYWVIGVQLGLMLLFLAAVSAPFLLLPWKYVDKDFPNATEALLKVRRVSEDEVLAEFLKAEFFQSEFDRYRMRFSGIVYHPDLNNARDNALRRGLLYHRRGRMWRELPRDIEWWEVNLRNSDLARIRVFPRKHWRILADGSFYLTDMVERIRAEMQKADTPFSMKMRSVTSDLGLQDTPDAVLLIGADETSPLTIIEGNHRMTASMLTSPGTVHRRFRFYCGFSPRMTQCCWYQTSLTSLFRYACNRAWYLFEDRDSFIGQNTTPKLGARDFPEAEAP